MNPIRQEIETELGFGMVPNIFAYAAGAPEAQTALWKAFRHIVLRGQLPRTTKEMMGVVVSHENRSPYAKGVHLHALMAQGLEQPLLEALSQGTPPQGLPAKTALLLGFAQAAARDPRDPGLIKLLEGDLSPGEIAEAVATVALFHMVNAWTDLMNIPLDSL
ncbi:MAG: carboxymuconolactone decarboxylase [Thermus sp.]